MVCKAYEFNALKDYTFADVFAQYHDKWIFCKHKQRSTWEAPGGHIEVGETPLEAAKRELFEERGATSFDLIPLCDYWITGEYNGMAIDANGQVYYANVHALGEIPPSEMETICLLTALPDNLTYPEYSHVVFPYALACANAQK